MESILIVEDNKDVNKLLKDVIEEAGYRTKSLYNGLDVIKD